MVKDGLIRIRNNLENFKIDDNINKGYFVRLNCGHNTTLRTNDEKIIKEIIMI